MEESEGYQKRSESDINGNGACKKAKQEMEYVATGTKRSWKPCTKYFSIAGCQLGNRCHFSHEAVYGYNPSAPNASDPNAPAPNFAEKKTLLCLKYESFDGCVEDEECPYAHGEEDLNGPITYVKVPKILPPNPASYLGHRTKPQTKFGATAKSSATITATRASAQGMPCQLYGDMSGTEISFEEHESDHTLLNIKLKGNVDDVSLGMQIVEDHIASTGPSPAPRLASITATRASTQGMPYHLYARISRTEISFEEHESDHNLLNIKLKGSVDGVSVGIRMIEEHIASIGPSPAPSIAGCQFAEEDFSYEVVYGYDDSSAPNVSLGIQMVQDHIGSIGPFPAPIHK